MGVEHVLDALVTSFASLRVVVVGDAILDAYLHGAAPRIAREAPVPVVRVEGREDAPGGAANAAANAAALGARVSLLAVVGTDPAGDELLARLEAVGVDVTAVVRDPAWATPAKHRLSAAGQILVRWDDGSEGAPCATALAELARRVAGRGAGADVVIASAYDGGVLAPPVRAALAALDGPLVLADARDPRELRDVSPTVATPNWAEAMSLLAPGGPASDAGRAQTVIAHRAELHTGTGARVVAVTLDADGAVVLEPGRPPHRTYAHPAEETCCAGAGDTWAAAFALALGAGATTTTAGEVAAAAAAVAVGKPGTALCSAEELRGALLPPGKVVPDPERLAALAEHHRREGRSVAFTNGCFDILHRGHVAFLAEAKALADVLVVGVNSDASVARLKGPDRPLNGLADRLEVLAGLSCVDHLVPFDSDRPEELLRTLRPSLYVKGGDYTPQTLPEAPLVGELGGEVRILGYLADRSTTRLVERVRSG